MSNTSTFSLIKETYLAWQDDEAFRQSAVIAYYSIFSLPALIIIVVHVAGFFFGQDAVQGQISQQIGEMIGKESAEQVQTMVANASQQGNSTIAIIIGVGTLIFGATGLFYQLQQSLNKVWDVEPRPEAGVKKVILDRASSLGIVLALGFLLLISLILTTIISTLSNWIEQQFPSYFVSLFFIVSELLSLGLITVLFAIIYKVLPDVRIPWKMVWIGAFVTAVLFTIGKFLLGFYFGKADPASTFGAAGSLILILLWVNYSGLIFLFGAEFTKVYARYKGADIRVSQHAQHTAAYKYHKEREEVSAGE
ncbi:MAG: YihY/virulence factor BrkB family protein [Cyclobacteriaceae bacterium]